MGGWFCCAVLLPRFRPHIQKCSQTRRMATLRERICLVQGHTFWFKPRQSKLSYRCKVCVVPGMRQSALASYLNTTKRPRLAYIPTYDMIRYDKSRFMVFLYTEFQSMNLLNVLIYSNKKH